MIKSQKQQKNKTDLNRLAPHFFSQADVKPFFSNEWFSGVLQEQ